MIIKYFHKSLVLYIREYTISMRKKKSVKIIRNKQRLKYFAILADKHKRITKLHSHCKSHIIFKKQQFHQDRTKIQIFTEEEYLSSIINHKQRLQKPIIFQCKQPPKFNYPQKIKVQIKKKQNSNKPSQIDYKINEETLYLEIQKQQFQEMCLSDNSQQLKHHSISVPQMEIQKQNYTIPRIVSQTIMSLYAVNLWHYKGQTLTKWHYDAHDNFLFQIKGSKNIWLSPPNSIQRIRQCFMSKQQKQDSYFLCLSPFNIDNNHLNQTNNRMSQKMNQDCETIKITLKQNQCIFLPAGWFHQVHSHTDANQNNVAINFWGNSIPANSISTQNLQINLKLLIYRFGEQIGLKSIKDWQSLPEDIKQNYRRVYFQKYLCMIDQVVN